MKLKLDEVQSWKGGGLLPPGRHICNITDVEEGTSSGGHPQLAVQLEAVDGDHVGGTITDWIVVIASTMGKVKQVLEAAGVEIPAGEFDLDPAQLVGKTVAIVVREEEYQGETKNRIAAYNTPSSSDLPGYENGDKPTGKDDDIPF